jgi:hypothetical protein
MCVHLSTNPRPFLTSLLSFELERLLLASCIPLVELQLMALHLSCPMHRYLRVTNQTMLTVLPTQAPKGDHWEHRRPITSVTSPLEVKPRFQDLDMVRFPALYIGSAVTVVSCVPNSLPVYYRVYSPTGGVEVKNPEFSEDPYLGRTLAIRITPPHLAASVKHHICGQEDIVVIDYEHTSLFADISCLSPLDDSEPVRILDCAGTGSTPGDPVTVVSLALGALECTHVPDGAGYQYKLKANYNCKVNGCTSRQVSDVFCSDTTHTLGWLSYKKGDILHTNGVPIKGEASHFKSKVCNASPHSITFQAQVPTPMMVFMLQMMLHKLVVVRTNLLISINWTSSEDLLLSCNAE